MTMHSKSSVASRHPIHGISEFANAAARLAHSYLPADARKVVLQLDDSSLWWIVSVALGSATFRPLSTAAPGAIWSPDTPPAAPSAYDEEFASGVGALVEFDPAPALIVPTVADGFLNVMHTSNGTAQWRGMYRAIPVESEWFAWTKLGGNMPHTAAAFQQALAITQDIVGAPSTADWQSIGMIIAAIGGAPGLYPIQHAWTSYNAGSVAIVNPSDGFMPYVGIGFVAPSTCTYWISKDCVTWIRLNTVTFTPTHIALASYNAIGETIAFRWPFLRFQVGAGKTSLAAGLRGGRLVTANVA